MEIINHITNSIVKNARDGETIRSLAVKTGFAYSAVYKWVMILKDYEVINLIKKGNKNIIRINNSEIYKKFAELDKAVKVIDKDKEFWNIIRKVKLNIRFTRSTAVVVWTQGSYITGDFIDKIYSLEVYNKEFSLLKKILENHGIAYSTKEAVNGRPFIQIILKNKKFKIEHKSNLPVIPLKELINWCRELYLDNVLEHLSSMYNLNLKSKYSEIKTNI